MKNITLKEALGMESGSDLGAPVGTRSYERGHHIQSTGRSARAEAWAQELADRLNADLDEVEPGTRLVAARDPQGEWGVFLLYPHASNTKKYLKGGHALRLFRRIKKDTAR